MSALDDRVFAIALDVGRLRRHLDAESYGGFLAWRIAQQIDGLDCLLSPTAAELYVADLPVEEALAIVDERSRTLRRLLGDER